MSDERFSSNRLVDCLSLLFPFYLPTSPPTFPQSHNFTNPCNPVFPHLQSLIHHSYSPESSSIHPVTYVMVFPFPLPSFPSHPLPVHLSGSPLFLLSLTPFRSPLLRGHSLLPLSPSVVPPHSFPSLPSHSLSSRPLPCPPPQTFLPSFPQWATFSRTSYL